MQVLATEKNWEKSRTGQITPFYVCSRLSPPFTFTQIALKDAKLLLQIPDYLYARLAILIALILNADY